MKDVPVAPRPAATLILVRDSPQGPETFMMQRTHKAAFVPGGYVFPGGALDAADTDAYFANCHAGMNDAIASSLLGVEAGGLAYLVAAIRECFEESGLLLARDRGGEMVKLAGQPEEPEYAVLRKQLAAAERDFADVCRSRHLVPAFDSLAYFAHWITPAGVPRRFDTRFFLAVAPESQTPAHDDGETIAHEWLRPADALSRHRAGELDMMFATVKTLELLGRFDNVQDLLQHVRSVQSVPVNRPRVSTGSKGRRVLLKGDHAYAEVGKLDPAGTGKASSEILPGVATLLSERVARIAAPNPGFMTGPGTNSYLIQSGEDFAVIDPGPAVNEHVERLLAHANGRIRWIFTTHTHLDHSPAAALIRERTGARQIGMPPPDHERQDRGYFPDTVIRDGDRIPLGSCTLQAIHTPGHASNHVCYLLEEERLLFTGDHIMQGSTVVINPPDGDMRAYLASLAKLKAFDVEYLAPGHGFLMDQPHAVVDRITAHRLTREKKVLAALRDAGQATMAELLPIVYDDVAKERYAMAARSLLAHLNKLKDEVQVVVREERWSLAE
ncbi:MAG TPA: MBL fold metallo-hydrolase [Noviherbaspirillum sp.]|uniref:MBL fold metallo-hydrolase n=1 Tax=Noviherbaspirillum sp. TaxID=1926288 RepID=UPI002DDD5B8E|nr:MBL fold metallo-hydrolase [Noviherbaspirillum sp.]HEV2608627.1 MBL fold metallo-hydrolase [Noviherbaspirillum sp.]